LRCEICLLDSARLSSAQLSSALEMVIEERGGESEIERRDHARENGVLSLP